MRAIQWPLAALACFSMTLSPSFRAMAAADEPAAVAAPTTRVVATEEKAAAAVDLSYVPATAVAAIVVHPQQVVTGENSEWLPVEVISAAGLQQYGFDPMDIQEAIAVIAPPDMSNPPKPKVLPPGAVARPRHPPEPGFGAVLHFKKPYSRRDVFAKLQKVTPTVGEVGGKKYLHVGGPQPGPEPIGVFMPDDRTLVVGSVALLEQMIVAKNVDSDLVKLARATDCSGTATALVSLDAVRDLIDQAMAHAPPVPPQFADFLKIPKLVSSGVVKADFRAAGEFSATLHCPDAKSAAELQQLIERGIAMGHQYIQAQIARESAHADDPVQQAMQKYSTRMTGKMFDALKPKLDGKDVKWSTSGSGPAGNVAVIGILIALLLPAVQAARAAAQRNLSQAKLKQIGLAMLNYESAYSHFPARAVFSKEGKPQLSWRVLILPYVEEVQLYKQFHLDEPWDSPNNLPLASRMPAAFADPAEPNTNKTHYVVPFGKGLIFDGEKGMRMDNIRDGASNTIMAVEADKAIIWSKPDDLEVDLEHPWNGLGNMRPNGFFALFADDHIQAISHAVSAETLKALFTRAGGEPINSSKLR